jgi:hypothetical protein
MFKTMAAIMLLCNGLFVSEQVQTTHDNYVPDEKTAILIAEAVLVDQFGKERVSAQSPLHAESHEEYWLVQGAFNQGVFNQKKINEENMLKWGGAFSVGVNKKTGCLNVIEKMK